MYDDPKLEANIIEATGLIFTLRDGRTEETNHDFRRAAEALSKLTDTVYAISEEPLIFKSCRSAPNSDLGTFEK